MLVYFSVYMFHHNIIHYEFITLVGRASDTNSLTFTVHANELHIQSCRAKKGRNMKSLACSSPIMKIGLYVKRLESIVA